MIYCVSDIHGELDKFERLLTLIQFSENDHLYVIGDAIDRCAMGVDILRLVMDTSNMTMLLGNHEQMCLATLGPHNEFGARELWRRNGGSSTYRELFYHRTPHERNMILRFLAGLPDHLDITVDGQQFHLVHGCPGADRDTRIWGRIKPEDRSPYPDTICIVATRRSTSWLVSATSRSGYGMVMASLILTAAAAIATRRTAVWPVSGWMTWRSFMLGIRARRYISAKREYRKYL